MKLNNFPANFMVGSTRDFKLAGSMLRNLFGSHVSSDLLLSNDAQIIQIKQIFWFIGSKLSNRYLKKRVIWRKAVE